MPSGMPQAKGRIAEGPAGGPAQLLCRDREKQCFMQRAIMEVVRDPGQGTLELTGKLERPHVSFFSGQLVTQMKFECASCFS